MHLKSLDRFERIGGDLSSKPVVRWRTVPRLIRLLFLVPMIAALSADDPVQVDVYLDNPPAYDETYPKASCPGVFTSPLRVYADHAGTRYYFWLRNGVRNSSKANFFWLGKYLYSDTRSELGGATLLAPWVDAICLRVEGPDGSSAVIVYEYATGGVLQINAPPPHSLNQPVKQETTPTSDTWCFFKNYFDDNWNYLYSEIIPNSCWTIYST